MKKLLLLLIAACGLIFLTVSCGNSEYEFQNLFPEKYHKILYFMSSEKQMLSLSSTQTNYKDSIAVVKGGSDPSLKANVKFEIMSQSLVDSLYGKLEGVNYKVVPQDAYTFDDGQEMSFDKDEIGKYLRFTIHAEKIYKAMKSNSGAKYVLPIRLVSQTDTIYKYKSVLFIVFDVNSPTIQLQDSDMVKEMYYRTLDIDLSAAMKNYGTNNWNFTCGFNQTGLDDLVKNYNVYHDTSYELLPASSYTLSDFQFVKGNNNATSTLSIKRDNLQSDHVYLLPLRLGDTSMGEQIDKSDNIIYLAISVPKYGITVPDRSSWKILLCNSDESKWSGRNSYGPEAILDNDDDTFWHCNWRGCWPESYQGQDPLGKNTGHALGDDYCYWFTDYNAFAARRTYDKIVIVLDMQEVRTVVGVGVTQLEPNYDVKSFDVYVSNDKEFLFKPLEKGGSVSDYNAVALNHWTKAFSYNNIPRQGSTSWYTITPEEASKGLAKGRFLKIQFTGSYRAGVVNMTEFYVRQLLSVDGYKIE